MTRQFSNGSTRNLACSPRTRALTGTLGVLGALSLSCVTACADGGGQETVGDGSEAIQGGTNDSATTAPGATTIRFTNDGSGFASCSGAKIGARKFLTAAHCVDHWNGNFTRGVLLSNNPTATPGGNESFIVTNVYVHPTWEIPQLSYGSNYDVAVFEVDRDSLSIPTVSLSNTAVRIGDTARLIGYGSGRRARADATADLPEAGHSNFDYGYIENTHILWQGNPTGEHGDSGAPLYNLSSGSYAVAGVVSGWDFTGYTGMGRIHQLRNWVLNPTALALGGTTGGYLINGSKAACLTSWGTETARLYCYQGNDNDAPQKWFMVAAGTYDGIVAYRLRNGMNGLCLGIRGNSLNAGARTEQQTCGLNSTYQKWKITSLGPINLDTSGGDIAPEYNYLKLQNVGSGRCLGAENGNTALETRVGQVTCSTPPTPRISTLAWIYSR